MSTNGKALRRLSLAATLALTSHAELAAGEAAGLPMWHPFGADRPAVGLPWLLPVAIDCYVVDALERKRGADRWAALGILALSVIGGSAYTATNAAEAIRAAGVGVILVLVLSRLYADAKPDVADNDTPAVAQNDARTGNVRRDIAGDSMSPWRHDMPPAIEGDRRPAIEPARQSATSDDTSDDSHSGATPDKVQVRVGMTPEEGTADVGSGSAFDDVPVGGSNGAGGRTAVSGQNVVQLTGKRARLVQQQMAGDLTQKEAARRAGVSERTFQRWVKEAKEAADVGADRGEAVR